MRLGQAAATRASHARPLYAPVAWRPAPVPQKRNWARGQKALALWPGKVAATAAWLVLLPLLLLLLLSLASASSETETAGAAALATGTPDVWPCSHALHGNLGP